MLVQDHIYSAVTPLFIDAGCVPTCQINETMMESH